MFAKSVLNSVFEAVFLRQPFLPAFKTAALSIREEVSNQDRRSFYQRSVTVLLESKTTKKFRSEVPSKQHNIQEGQSISTVKTLYKSMFPIKEKFKKYVVNNIDK